MDDAKKIVGVTFSTFDLLHAGHIAMLREAKTVCDYLIVGLQVDPSVDRADKNSPIQSLAERWMQLQAVKYVDEVIPYQREYEVVDILEMFDIDVRIIGEEYKHKVFTGDEVCLERGIKIYYNKRAHRFSSTNLRAEIHGVELKKDVGGLE